MRREVKSRRNINWEIGEGKKVHTRVLEAIRYGEGCKVKLYETIKRTKGNINGGR